MTNEVDPFSLWMEDGIMIGHYNVKHVNMEVAQYAFNLRAKMADGRSYPALAIMNTLVSIDSDAREFLAAEEAYSNVTAMAILMKSVFQKIAGSFFIYMNKPPVPTKIFTEKEAAVQWLNQYKINY